MCRGSFSVNVQSIAVKGNRNNSIAVNIAVGKLATVSTMYMIWFSLGAGSCNNTIFIVDKFSALFYSCLPIDSVQEPTSREGRNLWQVGGERAGLLKWQEPGEIGNNFATLQNGNFAMDKA